MIQCTNFSKNNTSSALAICLLKTAFKICLIAIMVICFKVSGYAQDKQDSQNYEALIYFEVDPFAYINKGYSLHLGYENWGMRFDLTKVKVDFPESFEEAFYNTKAFDLVTNITGIKVDYIGNRTNWTKNAFVGLDLNYQKLNFKHRTTLEDKDLNAINLGLRGGYKISLYKGLYVTPWAAVWKNINAIETFRIGTDEVSTNGWDYLVTFHIGYAFKF